MMDTGIQSSAAVPNRAPSVGNEAAPSDATTGQGAADGFALLFGQLTAPATAVANAASVAVAEQPFDADLDAIESTETCPIEAMLALLSAALPVEPAPASVTDAATDAMTDLATDGANLLAANTAQTAALATPTAAQLAIASNDAAMADATTVTATTTPAAILFAARQWLAGSRGDAANSASHATPSNVAALHADDAKSQAATPFLATSLTGDAVADDAFAASDFGAGSGSAALAESKGGAAIDGLRASTSTTFEAALSALAQRVAQTAPANATTAPVIVDAALPPPDAAQFGDELGAKVVWMTNQRISHAELRLSPADLGVVDVKLKLDGDQVSADFQAQRADTREALDASIPKLRELLSQQGLQLAHAGVGGQDGRESRQAAAFTPASPPSPDANGVASDGRDASAAQTVTVRPRSLLDEYA